MQFLINDHNNAGPSSLSARLHTRAFYSSTVRIVHDMISFERILSHHLYGRRSPDIPVVRMPRGSEGLRAAMRILDEVCQRPGISSKYRRQCSRRRP